MALEKIKDKYGESGYAFVCSKRLVTPYIGQPRLGYHCSLFAQSDKRYVMDFDALPEKNPCNPDVAKFDATNAQGALSRDEEYELQQTILPILSEVAPDPADLERDDDIISGTVWPVLEFKYEYGLYPHDFNFEEIGLPENWRLRR